VLPAIVLVPLAVLLLLPGLLTGPSLDPSIFTHVADQVGNGAVLYVDAWDHKPPGTYLLYAAAMRAVPFLDPWPVAWLLSVAATAGSGATLYAALRRLALDRWPALLASAGAVAAMAQYLTALGGGLTEPIAVLPLSVALLLALDRTGPMRGLAAGALLGAAVATSIPVIPGAVAVAGLLVAGPGVTRRATTVLALAAGGVAVAGAMLLWLAVSGALPAAVDAVIGYAAAYRSTNQAAGATLSAPVAAWTMLSFLFLVVPAALGLLAGLRGEAARRGVTLASSAWLLLSLALFVYQGRFFAHYAIPLAIPLGILAGIGLERASKLGSRTLIHGTFAVALLISIAAGLAGGLMEFEPVARDHQRSGGLASVIQAETGADDQIWVWGNETELYLAADRPSATRYSYLYPLVTPGYSTPEMVAATLRQLEAAPPALVIDAGSVRPGWPGFQQLLIPRPLVSDGRDLDILDPLRTFIAARYEELEIVDGWVIYRLRQAP
jgi:hypothetical protein